MPAAVSPGPLAGPVTDASKVPANDSVVLSDGLNDVAMVVPVDVRLFGGFAATVRGVPLRKLRTRHGTRLLALLALGHGRELDRRTLAARLWPDVTDRDALVSLRRALTDLRDALGPEAARLESMGYMGLRLDLASGGATCDVVEYDRALAAGTPDGIDRAVDLYGGLLMPDLDAVADPEGTIRNERDRTLHAFLEAIERRARRRQADGQFSDAASDLRRLLAVDPTRESASCQLMELLTSGDAADRAGAMGEYARLRRALKRELGTEPAHATRALHERIKRNRRSKSERPAAALFSMHPLVAPTRAPRHNLPTRMTRFIGREAAVNAICGLLRANRLLTLTGTGGVGKTRLAQHVASLALADFPDGVWQVELAALSLAADPVLIARGLANVLGVREVAGQSISDTMIGYLMPKRLLLVLDNCEHVLDACAHLATSLLEACPGVTILATSREPIGVPGEQNFRVPSLTTPNTKQIAAMATAAELAAYEAVRLFVDRARLVTADFALADDNAPTVARLCLRLDGIPLALELAAARTHSFRLDEMVERLDDCFGLLTTGNRAALPRQQTLRALVDWSYDLLTESEKTFFASLSVFEGGWTGDAAEVCCAGDAAVDSADALTLLAGLVDKSLVLEEKQESGFLRYRMLETLRQYAAEKLFAKGETANVAVRHRDFFAAFAKEAQPQLYGPEQGIWLNRLEAEHENFRRALDTCAAGVVAAAVAQASEHAKARDSIWNYALTGLQLAGALSRFWKVRGFLSEGREQLARARTRAQAVQASSANLIVTNEVALMKSAMAAALEAEGFLAYSQGDSTSAQTLSAESLSLYRELGDKNGIASTLGTLGIIANRRGNYSESRALSEESLRLYRKLGDKNNIAKMSVNLGNTAYSQDDYPAAQSLYDEGLCLYRQTGNGNGIADTLSSLGNVAYCQDDPVAAQRFYKDSLSHRREIGDKHGIALTLLNLGQSTHVCGDLEAARLLYDESLNLCRDVGDKHSITYVLEAMATLCAEEGKGRRAVTLWAAAAGLRESIGAPLSPGEKSQQDAEVEKGRASLGDTAFAAAWYEGRAMTWKEAVACALREDGGCPS